MFLIFEGLAGKIDKKTLHVACELLAVSDVPFFEWMTLGQVACLLGIERKQILNLVRDQESDLKAIEIRTPEKVKILIHPDYVFIQAKKHCLRIIGKEKRALKRTRF